MARYVALLRGINVGGNNLIRMTALKACFEKHFEDVATYIQSGNVLFSTARCDCDALVQRLEKLLASTFDYRASVVLRTAKQMRDIVGNAPRGFGALPAKYRYDVLFLKDPLTAAEAMKSVTTREGVDEAHAGVGVLYFSRLASRASQSRLSRIASMPIYQSLTIRNWNTTTKLLELLSSYER